MSDSHPVPKVFISLRLLLFRYESHIANHTLPFLFLFFNSEKKTNPVSLRNERHILFHLETKDTSCFIQKRKTHPIPQLSPSCLSKWFILSRRSIFFQIVSWLFVYFIEVRICIVNPNYTLPIPCLSLRSQRHSFSHGIISFICLFIVWCFLFFKI